jgi:plasmid maintenance system antidote protein VapI
MDREGVSMLQELAERAGIHPNTLTKVLSGESWTPETAVKLAVALNCNPIDLLVAEGFPDPNWAALAVPSLI